MGLFGKSEEEKKQEKLGKEQEQQRKMKEAFQILGLELDSYSDEEIKERNKKDFWVIGSTVGLETIGELFSGFGMTNYQRISSVKFNTIVHQNWVLIRQNELIIRGLDKMLKALTNKNKAV